MIDFGFCIEDKDIDNIENLFKDIKFDSSRRKIIKNLTTVDIQAFPGTGKTTLLIGKLAILANKWKFLNKGICILSYTNVAREEIEDRLGGSNLGKKILSYPHFIGTVHSFFDTYVSIPWLKSQSKKITLIDYEKVIKYRNFLLKNKSGFAVELRKQHLLQKEAYCDEEGKSFKSLLKQSDYDCNSIKEIIERTQEEGYYTFDEILQVAEFVLKNNTNLSNIISKRFPFVMVDEAQDTNDYLCYLLSQTFTSDSIIQRFGDVNQSIFENSTTYLDCNIALNKFPSNKYLSISNSLRFNGSIAKLANSLATDDNSMLGESTLFNHLSDKNTIIFFSRDRINDVLPTFGNIVLDNFTDDEIKANGKYGVHAIGCVHSKYSLNQKDTKFPQSVKDYWINYDSNLSSKAAKPKLLCQYFLLGKQTLPFTGSIVECYSKGFVVLLKNNNIEIFNSNNSFNVLLKLIQSDKRNDFRHDLFKLCCLPFGDKNNWSEIIKNVKLICKDYFNIELDETDGFLEYSPLIDEVNSAKSNNNIFHYENNNGRSVEIELGSIHSCKGRTHLATLVLDTFYWKRNLNAILPWLIKTKSLFNIDEGNDAHNSRRLRVHYVGLTRAKGIICLAILDENVTAEIKNALSNVGWKIIHLSPKNGDV